MIGIFLRKYSERLLSCRVVVLLRIQNLFFKPKKTDVYFYPHTLTISRAFLHLALLYIENCENRNFGSNHVIFKQHNLLSCLYFPQIVLIANQSHLKIYLLGMKYVALLTDWSTLLHIKNVLAI